VLNHFPFLNIVRLKRDALSGCKPCQAGKKGDELRAAIKDAQRHIAMMSDTDKATLKRLLNAQSVRVYHMKQEGANTVRDRIDF